MTYEKYNANPLNKKTSDCTVRAISLALEKTWIEVFDDLTTIARELHTMPNDKECTGEYLKQYPTIPVKYDAKKGKKRLTVKQVSELQGTYIVKAAHHLVCTKDGKYYDIWDSGNKSAYKIWQIK